MKKILLFLLSAITIFSSLPPSSFAQPPLDPTSVNMGRMGLLDFGMPRNIPALGMIIMIFLGKVIIYASVLGFMIGGGMMVFSAGDEGLVSRGKDVMIASVVGLLVTLLSYIIVTLTQGVLYGIGGL